MNWRRSSVLTSQAQARKAQMSAWHWRNSALLVPLLCALHSPLRALFHGQAITFYIPIKCNKHDMASQAPLAWSTRFAPNGKILTF